MVAVIDSRRPAVAPMEPVVSYRPNPTAEPFEDSAFASVLADAQAGDGVAFASLYERHNRAVHAFVRLQQARDPEGTVNEVFMRAYRSLLTFEGTEAKFRGWLLAIAKNRLIDEARRRAVRPAEVPLDAAETQRSAADGPEIEALRTVVEADLRAHLDTLTADQREVLLLRIVGDLSLAATAEVVGKEVGAVKALQQRGLRRLQTRIGSIEELS